MPSIPGNMFYIQSNFFPNLFLFIMPTDIHCCYLSIDMTRFNSLLSQRLDSI